jgi:hypothetical protein
VRRALILAIVAAAVLVAGCGSSRSSSAPRSPVATALSYIPANSPFVLTAATTSNPGGQALVNRLPDLALAETALFARLRQLGIDYNADVRPLFGNPIVGGLVLHGANGAPNQFVAAWVTKDQSKLEALLKKLEPGLQKLGTRDGATVYSLGELALATDDATVVFASTQPELNAALDRQAHGGGITPNDYSKAFTGLPQNGRLQVFGSLSQVLSMPSAAKAQSVPWVAALRGYAASISESSAGLTFQYRLDTTGRSLSESDLPIASGSTAPNFAGAAPIVAAVRNPAQIFTFAENAERVTNPAQYQRFIKRQAAVRSKTGVDLTSLIKLATGDLIVDSDTHTTIGRVQVSDPATAKTTIAKLAAHPTAISRIPPTIKRLPGGFYTIKSPHSKAVTVGVVGNQLVAGQATPAQLRSFAVAPPAPATGAQGAVAFKIALADVIRLASKRPLTGIGATVLKMLGDLTGWAAASPSQLTGNATLTVK